MQGCDSFHLRILSSLEASTSSVEAENYFFRCVKELSLSVPSNDLALLAYANETAQQIVAGEISGNQGVQLLHQLWVASDYDSDFTIWLELDNARGDLLAGADPCTYETATLANIDSIIKDEARKFIVVMRERMKA